MNIELLEDEIKSKLLQDLPSTIDIEFLPDSLKDFETVFEKPKISICFNNIVYENPQSVNLVSQHAFVQLELAIQSARRRGYLGVFDLYDKVKKSLLGYDPINCDRIYFKDFKLEEYGNNDDVWYYTLKIECKTIIVQDFTEATTPLFTEATTEIEHL